MTASTRNLAQRFPGRRAFITGAASGFGLACAELLAREGWRLLLTDIDGVRLSIVAGRLAAQGVQVQVEACDVRDPAALERVAGIGLDAFGGLDLSIHAAGVVVAGPFVGSDTRDWQWLFDINVHGVANSCRAVLPIMLRQQSGLIINIASAASFCTGANMAGYNASKAAVVALSETLHQEHASQGVQVVAAMPGFFRTRLMEGARGPERVIAAAYRLMEQSQLDAGEVAEQVLIAAGAGKTHFVYPARYRWLWRIKRLAPQFFQRWFPRSVARTRRVSNGQ